MTISNAEILDTVRRLRSYVVTLDNCHLVLDGLSGIDDETIVDNVEGALPDIISTSKKVSIVLKLIEASKLYRDMLKKFNMKDEPAEEEDDYV